MVRFTLFTTAFLLLARACFGQSKNYIITGRVDSVTNGTKIYLRRWQMDNVDSTIIVNKTFTFKGTVNEPVEALLVIGDYKQNFKKSKMKLLWIENATINITGNGNNFSEAKVTGSAANLDYENYTNELSKEGIDPEGSIMMSDSVKSKALVTYVKKHPNSYKGVFELYLNRGIIPFATIKQLYGSLSDKVKASAKGINLLTYINKFKQPKVGGYAPDFTLTNVNGNHIKLSDYKGKYVLIEFWASSCGPCRMENPYLNNAYQKYHDKGFEIIGISLDSKKDAEQAIAKDKLQWVNGFDEKGFEGSTMQTYGIWYIPQNFLIDPTGKIINIELRESMNQVSEKLDKLLDK